MPLSSFLQKILIRDKRSPVATSNPLVSATDLVVDAAVQPYIIRSNTVGLGIGIIKDRLISTYGYGKTKRGNQKIPGTDNIFETGSITKTFTATLLAWYANEGKLNLSDPITKYLPVAVSDNPELKGIRLIHLSNHTSGLPRLPPNLYVTLDNPYKNYTQEKLFSALTKIKLKSAPGEVYAYSNFATGLLGVILERVSGRSYEEMVSQIITGPLNMTNTLQHASKTDSEKLVDVHNAWGRPVPRWDFEALVAAGGLSSNVGDLLLFAQANMQPKGALGDAFVLTHQLTFAKGTKIALGWHQFTLNGDDYLWHNGGTAGCKSFLLFNAEKDIAVVVLSNSAVSCDTMAIRILKGICST